VFDGVIAFLYADANNSNITDAKLKTQITKVSGSLQGLTDTSASIFVQYMITLFLTVKFGEPGRDLQ
jgi:hypothetical protein